MALVGADSFPGLYADWLLHLAEEEDRKAGAERLMAGRLFLASLVPAGFIIVAGFLKRAEKRIPATSPATDRAVGKGKRPRYRGLAGVILWIALSASLAAAAIQGGRAIHTLRLANETRPFFRHFALLDEVGALAIEAGIAFAAGILPAGFLVVGRNLKKIRESREQRPSR